MTDFDSMPAGAEMDRAVAERVMGWGTGWCDRRWYTNHSYHDSWHQEEAPSREACRFTPVEYYRVYGKEGYSDGAMEVEVGEWHPSTNIAHAWEVVERLVATSHHIALDAWDNEHSGDGRYFCCVTMPDWHDTGDKAADSMPLAICRAALAAIQIESEKP